MQPNPRQQTHLFIIDPLEKLNLKRDSSLRMAYELSRRGHRLYVADTSDLSWLAHAAGPGVRARPLYFTEKEAVQGAESAWTGEGQLCQLSHFHGVHMRKDPPYDLDYIAATWLLDAVGPQTRVFNAPSALRNFNEKLGILRFPDAIQPALVSADPEELLRFAAEQCGGDAVVKPLDLYAGRGILRLKVAKGAEQKARAQLEEALAAGTRLRLIQAFNPDIYSGEVRAFTLGGKPLAWCLKKPAPGEFLANTAAGASLHPFIPSPSLVDRVTKIATELLREGVSLCGFDLIGDFVSEVNITSPRLLKADEDNSPYYAEIACWLERACR